MYNNKSRTCYRIQRQIYQQDRHLYAYRSVWLHDSVSVILKGDTVYTDRWRYKDRYKFVYKNTTDTMIVRDSIPYTVTIEKPLSKKDKYYIAFGKIAQGVIFVLIVILIVLIDRKNK